MKLVFADLDGTILDPVNYSTEKSSEGISILHKKSIPLILASAKTRAEMTLISEELSLNYPFIFENGSGIDFNRCPEPEDLLLLAPPMTVFIETISKLSAAGFVIKTITQMSEIEVIDHTGLPEKNARLARLRTGSLPFILINEKIIDTQQSVAMNRVLAGSGFKIITGTRFYHLVSETIDKAEALKQVVLFYKKRLPDKKIFSAAIGDGENDISMFEAADRAFFVGNETLSTPSDKIFFTKMKGPEGFTEAVKIISES